MNVRRVVMASCQKLNGLSSSAVPEGTCGVCIHGPCTKIGNNDNNSYVVTETKYKTGDDQPDKHTRIVVCAANKYGLVVFIGVRHFCPVMRQSMEYWKAANKGSTLEALRSTFGEVQGFIDQYGVFMDRKEAYAVASAAGQINTRRPKGYPEYMLFSEDLY
jgi:hypothetical protein